MVREKAKAACLALGIGLVCEEAAHVQSLQPDGTYTITLAWDPPPDDLVMTYVIEAGSGPGRSDITVFETGATPEPRLVVARVPAGIYFVRVRARNYSGVSDPSNEIVVSLGMNTGVNLGNSSCAVPVAPGGLTSINSKGVVTLRWVGSPGATSYELEAGSTPGTSDLFRGDVGDLTTLVAYAPPMTVFVRVRARNHCGVSPPSNEVSTG